MALFLKLTKDDRTKYVNMDLIVTIMEGTDFRSMLVYGEDTEDIHAVEVDEPPDVIADMIEKETYRRIMKFGWVDIISEKLTKI